MTTAIILQLVSAGYIWITLQTKKQSPNPVKAASSRLEVDPMQEVYKHILLNESDFNATSWKVKPEFFRYLLQRTNKNLQGFEANHEADDRVVEYLEGFPLTKLVFNYTHITKACLPRIMAIASLERLEIGGLNRLTPDDLKSLLKLGRLNQLSLSSCGLNDDCAKTIGAHDFTELSLFDNSEISDNGVAHVLHGPLVVLDFGKTSITDKSVSKLSRISSLQRLYLSGDKITDKSLPYIARLKKLAELDLSSTLITDRGLSSFSPSDLKVLYIRNCKGLTASGIKEFQHRQPQCQVFSQSLSAH